EGSGLEMPSSADDECDRIEILVTSLFGAQLMQWPEALIARSARRHGFPRPHRRKIPAVPPHTHQTPIERTARLPGLTWRIRHPRVVEVAEVDDEPERRPGGSDRPAATVPFHRAQVVCAHERVRQFGAMNPSPSPLLAVPA